MHRQRHQHNSQYHHVHQHHHQRRGDDEPGRSRLWRRSFVFVLVALVTVVFAVGLSLTVAVSVSIDNEPPASNRTTTTEAAITSTTALSASTTGAVASTSNAAVSSTRAAALGAVVAAASTSTTAASSTDHGVTSTSTTATVLGSTSAAAASSTTAAGSTSATTAASSTATTQATSLAAGGSTATSSFAASSSTTTTAASSSTTGTTSAAATSTTGTTSASTTIGASTSTTGTTGADPGTLVVYADAVNGNDTYSGRSSGSPVQTLTKALAIVSATGYQTACTISLAAGTYPTPNGTLFNGTPVGTHTDPVVIAGTANSTAVWCDSVYSTPAVVAPSPLYGFETTENIPVAQGIGASNYYGGFTMTLTNGPDSGVSYTIAYNASANQFYLAYDSTVGPAPAFVSTNTFCLYGPPLSIIEGATDNALWLSTNGFPHTLQNVQVQAYSGGAGLLQWQGLDWSLSNVWLTGQYGAGGAGINVTASAGCTLAAGEALSARQGLVLGVSAGNFSVAAQSLLTLSGASTTATLQNSVFQAGALVVGASATSASLTASFLWGNAALTSSASAPLTATTLFAAPRSSSYYLAYSIAGSGTATLSSSYLLGPLLAISSSGSVTISASTITSTAAHHAITLSSGTTVIVTGSTVNGASYGSDVISLTGGSLTINTTTVENVASSNNLINLVSGTPTLSLGAGTVLTPTSGTALYVSAGTATLTNVTVTGGTNADSALEQVGGSVVVTNSAFTRTSGFAAIDNQGGTLVISGSTIDGGNYGSSTWPLLYVAGPGHITIMGGTVAQNVGHQSPCLLYAGSGTLLVNGSSVFRNCGTTTSDIAISVLPLGSGGTVTMTDVIIGPNPGTGIYSSLGSSTGGSLTLTSLSSPTGQPNAEYAVRLATTVNGVTLYEKTGTNTNFIGSVADVNACNTDNYAWSTLDSGGTTTCTTSGIGTTTIYAN